MRVPVLSPAWCKRADTIRIRLSRSKHPHRIRWRFNLASSRSPPHLSWLRRRQCMGVCRSPLPSSPERSRKMSRATLLSLVVGIAAATVGATGLWLDRAQASLNLEKIDRATASQLIGGQCPDMRCFGVICSTSGCNATTTCSLVGNQCVSAEPHGYVRCGVSGAGWMCSESSTTEGCASILVGTPMGGFCSGMACITEVSKCGATAWTCTEEHCP